MNLTSEARDGTAVVTAAGDVDLASAGELGKAIGEAAACGDVILDIRDVGFMDSSGLNALLIASRELEAQGLRLALVVDREGTVARLLEITELGSVFSSYESLEAATEALASEG